MGKRFAAVGGLLLAFCLIGSGLNAQPVDGENEYNLAAVNPRFLGSDTLDANAGRGVWVAYDPDLDSDGKPEILVTNYSNGGRVFVFEVVGDNTLEFVWASKILEEPRASMGGGSSPRSVTTGDFDNNGKQEIVFQIGFNPNDSTDAANRGIYFYEWTGQDDDYGAEPIFKLTYEDVDSNFAQLSVGREENGMLIQDIDGDGKNEFLFPPRALNALVSKLYIMQVASGTFENGDVVIENEFVYEEMIQPPFLAPDSYAPSGIDIGDVDKDGLDEIVVGGFTNIGRGIGLGFIQIDGPDSYTPGSVIAVWDQNLCCVKYKPLIATVKGEPVIYLHRTSPTTDKIWVVEGIIADSFVDASNVKELFTDVGIFSIWALGDQDHPTQSAGDGFDLYLSNGATMLDIEYDGSGNVADPNSYSITQMFDLRDIYDNVGGLFDDVFTFPGMDLDKDGMRDIVTSYKGSGIDSLSGNLFAANTFNVFVFEWGDSTQANDVITSVPQLSPFTLITPDDYHLEQNYPNPFNPTTNIVFTLPVNKAVSLKIYNSLGQEVRTLLDHELYPAGTHTVQWDATDNSGNRVASGVYIYKLIFGNFAKTKQMTLVR